MPMLSAATWAKVIWKGDEFVAIARSTVKTAKSPDGITWVEYSGLPAAYAWTSMAWNGTVLVALAGTGRIVAISSDGITWTEYPTALPGNGNWVDILWNGSLFVALAKSASGGSNIATSTDGITWTTRSATSRNHQRLAWNGSRFATHTSGTPGYFYESADGIATWNARSITGTTWAAEAFAAAPGSGPFVSVGRGTDAIRIMSDTFAMSSSLMPLAANWQAMAFGAAQFAVVAYGSSNAATVSADGITTTLRALPVSANWRSIAYGGGRFVAVSESVDTAVSLDDGVTWSATAPDVGTATCHTALLVSVPEFATCHTALLVSAPIGVATASTALSTIASGAAQALTALAVVDADAAAEWTARCLIDGVDVSARLVDSISVTADEGAARIAAVSLRPASGAIDPLDYVGKPISIDYVRVIDGVEVPQRLFTGRIDTPEYSPASTLLKLYCVDDLQNRVAALPRSVIDSLVGGRYTPAVQGDVLDNWDYAEARLSTLPSSLDAGPSGGMRVTPWHTDDVWATFGSDALLYDTSVLRLPQRSVMVNRVDIEFEYRYPRLRQRFASLGWSGTALDMAPAGYAYPSQQDVLGAAGGSGWTVTAGVFYPAPAAIPHPSGGFVYPREGAIDMAILYLTQRHSQTVTETYSLTVSAPESVAQNGALPHALRGALASNFDGGAWESALDIDPLMPSGGDMDWMPDAPRADADYAINTLLDQARTKILSSHRGARVGNATLCNPDIDLDKRVAIAEPAVSAAGKVASVEHTLDISAGSAITYFEIAVSGAGGAGIITPDTLAPPAPPAEAADNYSWHASVPPLSVNTYGITPYSDGIMGLLLNPPESIYVENIPPDNHSESFPNAFYVAGSYPLTGFRVSMPGVDDALRNPLDKPVAASYSVVVPADMMSFTVP